MDWSTGRIALEVCTSQIVNSTKEIGNLAFRGCNIWDHSLGKFLAINTKSWIFLGVKSVASENNPDFR